MVRTSENTSKEAFYAIITIADRITCLSPGSAKLSFREPLLVSFIDYQMALPKEGGAPGRLLYDEITRACLAAFKEQSPRLALLIKYTWVVCELLNKAMVLQLAKAGTLGTLSEPV
jgi:hypothetical protein